MFLKNGVKPVKSRIPGGELVLLEEFRNCLPEAAVLVDEFVLTH